MASFTDQLVAFNPYIAQLPVDAYTRVGMIKQQQYNEGVQKVQSYIDSVAGIDVVKPEQKQYLQQRVGQLQGEVGGIVSKDFSNQQLVNSVGNLTNKIAGDPIVQNAVASTQRYRQGLSDMKEAKEKGTLSPSNEYVFQKGVQDWLGDGDVKSSFNGEYEAYTDTKKPILEAINALKPSANITDIPYETDPAGNYILDKRGQRKIAYATLREKLEGVSEARVKQAIEASITPQMRRQFQIDGQYNYRGVDKTGLKQMTDASYNHRLEQVNDVIKGLVVDANGSQNDPARKASIQRQIDQYKLGAQDLISQYKQDVEFLDKNPDQYKGELNYQDEMAKYTLGYAWSKHSLTYEKNPIFDGVMKEKEYNLNWDKFLELSRYHEGELGIREREAEIKEAMFQMKFGKLKNQGGGAFQLDLPVNQAIDESQLQKINLSTIQDQATSMADELDKEKMKAVAQMDGGSAWVTNREGQLIYKDAASKDAAETALKTLKTSYDKDPANVSPALQTYFSNFSNQDAIVQNYKTTADKIMKDADERYGTKTLTKGVSPLTYKDPNGQTYNFTPEELLDVAEKEQKQSAKYPVRFSNIDPTSGGFAVEPRSEQEEASYMAPFNQKEKALITALNSGKLDKGAMETYNKASGKLSSPVGRATLDARNDYIQTEARRAYTQNQGAAFPIVAYKTADMNRIKAATVQIINDQKQRGVENANPNFNEGDILKMLDEKDSKGTTYALIANPDGSNSIRFSNTTISGKPREIDITPDQAEKWFGTFVNQFRPIQQAINLSKYNGVGNTTDVRGGGKDTAYNIPQSNQLNNYSVKYHVEEPYDGQYQLKLYIYDKKGKQWLPDKYADFGGQMLNQQQILAAVNNLTDNEINRMYGKNKPGPVLPQQYGGIPAPGYTGGQSGPSDNEGEEEEQLTNNEEDNQ